jgi:VanZ family protein
MTFNRKTGVAASAVLALCATVALLVPMPQDGPPHLPHIDKLVHAVLFGAVALPSMIVVPGLWHWGIWGIVVGYSGLMELVQPIFGRGADLADLLANATGAALAMGIARWHQSKLAKVQQRQRAKPQD